MGEQMLSCIAPHDGFQKSGILKSLGLAITLLAVNLILPAQAQVRRVKTIVPVVEGYPDAARACRSIQI